LLLHVIALHLVYAMICVLEEYDCRFSLSTSTKRQFNTFNEQMKVVTIPTIGLFCVFGNVELSITLFI